MGGHEDMGQDLYYVPQKAIDGIKEKLKNGKVEADIKPFLDQVMNPEEIPDEEMMLPVDMRGVGKEYDSVEDMVKDLGVVGAAEAFLKAREDFEANKDNEPEEERPSPMTAKAWRSALLEGEEEEIMEGEESDGLDEEEEEGNEDFAPAEKKQKT